MSPLSDIQNSEGPSPFFDDKLIVVDATRAMRGEVRGIVPPLLLDLPRKTTLLHDDSVAGTNFDAAAELLLNPSRGTLVAHPFYVANNSDRLAVIEFLKSLEIRPAGAMMAVSAANFAGKELAPDSIATIFGTLLATGTESSATGGPPTALAGTTVEVTDSKGVTRMAGILYASPNQINLIIPAATAVGTAMITVTSADGIVTAAPTQVALISPSLFSANANGGGVAAAMIMRRAGGTDSFEPVFQLDPGTSQYIARPIDLGPESDQVVLMLFGTGIRGLATQSAVGVKVGGVDVPVLSAGAQGSNGLDQINITLPRTLIGRGTVDVAVSVDGKAANIVRISLR